MRPHTIHETVSMIASSITTPMVRPAIGTSTSSRSVPRMKPAINTTMK